MANKSFSILILVLCLGLFLAGCPKKKVAVYKERPSVQKSEEARRLEAERAAKEAREVKEAREAQEAKERELARIKEEEAKIAQGRELEKSLVAKKERESKGRL